MKLTEFLVIFIENPLANITLFGGLLFVLVGLIMTKFPPKKINYLYGYRTRSSMQNQERWDFAQKFSSVKMIQYGLILSFSCVLAFTTNFDKFINMLLGLGLLILLVVMLFLTTEKALKSKFDN